MDVKIRGMWGPRKRPRAIRASSSANEAIPAVDGRLVSFAVRAHDGAELIGEGTPVRAVVDKERFMGRVRAKGEIDLSAELYGPVFEPLRDVDYFKQVKVDPELGTIVWPKVRQGSRSRIAPTAPRRRPTSHT